MPVLIDKLMHKFVRTKLSGVQQSPTGPGESCSQPFSQCEPPVVNVITQDKATSGGICAALSAQWIKQHGVDHKAAGQWLCPGGTVDADMIDVASALQGVGDKVSSDNAVSSEDFTMVSQHTLILNWMERKKMKRYAMEDQKGTAVALLADAIADANCKPYRYIYLNGLFSAHCVAAHRAAAGSMLFFDPNFGEFSFPTDGQFKAWFTNKFWSLSAYNHGLSKTWDVYYLKKV